MHRFGAWLPALLLLTLTGCFTSPTARPSTWLDRFRAANSTLPPDGVLLEIYLVEQESLDDEFLNHGLWKSTDQQVTGIKRKAVLETNGFRIGQVVGVLPRKLQDLLLSERSCIKSTKEMLASGNPKMIPLGPRMAQSQFALHQDGQTTAVLLVEAQAQLVVTPTLTDDGRTTLHFLPQIEHSQIQPDIQPAPDRHDWVIEYHRPRETYADLSWEVTLAPNEYVVIGAFTEDLETLGAQCFAQEDAQSRVQRLLVIRTTRNLPDGEAALETGSQEQAPPLALQAILSTSPASGP